MIRFADVGSRLRQPWSRGRIILVTAAVAATAGYAVAAGEFALAAAREAQPVQLAEESWLDETVTESTTGPGSPLLDEVVAQLPPGAPEDVPTLTFDFPATNLTAIDLLALPAGSYEIHIGCRYLDPELEELGAGAAVDMSYGPQSPEFHNFSAHCGEEVHATGERMSHDTAVAVSATAWPILSRDGRFPLEMEEAVLNAELAVAVFFVPVGAD